MQGLLYLFLLSEPGSYRISADAVSLHSTVGTYKYTLHKYIQIVYTNVHGGISLVLDGPVKAILALRHLIPF